MRPYPQQYEHDWHPDDPSSPCVLCGSELGLPLEIGGHHGVRELTVCRACEGDYEALVQLVDDLDYMDRRSPRKRAGFHADQCSVCGAPTCDCRTALGEYWSGHG